MRNTWRVLNIAAALVAAVAFVAAPAAAATKSFPLKGLKDSPKASGTAILKDDELTVTAKGLKPNAIYTVWFVNTKPSMTKEGAGTAPYSFTTDAKGNAKYETHLSESPIGKWQSIMIVRHPSGDPKDMNRMADALMAKLM